MSSSNGLSLRILTPRGGLTFTGGPTSSPAAVSGTGAVEGPFATNLSIKAGDVIGLDNTTSAIAYGDNTAATTVAWNLPILANGSTRPGTSDPQRETLVQATVDPSNKSTFGTPTLNKKKGTAMLPVHVPNAGTLGYGITAGTVHGPASTSGEGDVALIVKATRRARRKLNQTGKVKETVLVTFTPTSGTPLTVSDSFKLRKTIKR